MRNEPTTPTGRYTYAYAWGMAWTWSCAGCMRRPAARLTDRETAISRAKSHEVRIHSEASA